MATFIPRDPTNTQQHDLLQRAKSDKLVQALLSQLDPAAQKRVEERLKQYIGVLTSGVAHAAAQKMAEEDQDG